MWDSYPFLSMIFPCLKFTNCNFLCCLDFCFWQILVFDNNCMKFILIPMMDCYNQFNSKKDIIMARSYWSLWSTLQHDGSDKCQALFSQLHPKPFLLANVSMLSLSPKQSLVVTKIDVITRQGYMYKAVLFMSKEFWEEELFCAWQ